VGTLSPASTALLSPVVVLAETQTATLQAHEAYLQFATALQGHFAQTVAWQTAILEQGVSGEFDRSELPAQAVPADGIPRSLDFEQCVEFARGLIGNV